METKNDEMLNSINTMVDLMLKYQKNNHITGNCITNCSFLCDTIKYNHKVNVKVRETIVIDYDSTFNILKVVGGHVVVLLQDYNNNEILIDPSYEIFALKNKRYCFSASEITKTIKELEITTLCNFDIDKKEIITHLLEFKEIAERTNAGKTMITDEIYYNEQADFVELAFKF